MKGEPGCVSPRKKLTRSRGGAEDVCKVLKISMCSLWLKNTSADFVRDPEWGFGCVADFQRDRKAPRDGRHPEDVSDLRNAEFPPSNIHKPIGANP